MPTTNYNWDLVADGESDKPGAVNATFEQIDGDLKTVADAKADLSGATFTGQVDITPDATSTTGLTGAQGVFQKAADSLTAAPTIYGQAARGASLAAKTVATAGKELLKLVGGGWNGSAWANASALILRARETFSGSQNGSEVVFEATPAGATSRIEVAWLDERGLKPPSMTTSERDALVSPRTGGVIFNTTTGKLNAYNGSAWSEVGGGSIGGTTGSTDNAILRADGTGGATVQSSGATLSDAGALGLPDLTEPGTPTGLLYAVSGALKWAGNFVARWNDTVPSSEGVAIVNASGLLTTATLGSGLSLSSGTLDTTGGSGSAADSDQAVLAARIFA